MITLHVGKLDLKLITWLEGKSYFGFLAEESSEPGRTIKRPCLPLWGSRERFQMDRKNGWQYVRIILKKITTLF